MVTVMRWVESEYHSPPTLLTVLWTLTLIDRVASCELWKHPLGYELRIMYDTELRRSMVHPSRRDAESDSAETKARLLSYGFTGGET